MTDESLPIDALLDNARRDLTPVSDLDERLARLGAAVQTLEQRGPSATLDEAAAVVSRASARLRLSADHTVVALAGATGSGKSSTFNALTGLDVATVGVRRPTTSWAMACLWGSDGAADLLEWLGIPIRHQVVRDSLLDSGDTQPLQGMVLLDLPDHDSTEVAHRLEVDRLVRLADVIVWVMDPQKYADAAIHDRLLRPNVQHADVMMAVVNHMDEVPEEGRARLYSDARRLLDADGLSSVPLIATSARVGTGIDDLKALLAERIASKAASRTRISADVDVTARQLLADLGAIPSSATLPDLRLRLTAALADVRRNPDGTTRSDQVLPETVRNAVRSELRSFSAQAAPAVADTITDRGVEQVEPFIAALSAQPMQQRTREVIERRGVGRAWKALFFIAMVIGGAWLAAALTRDIPNVIAAGGLTSVAAVAWIASLLIKRGEAVEKSRPVDVDASVSAALNATIMPAVAAEVAAYEQAFVNLVGARSAH